MGYYEYDTGYYEPSNANIFFDEMKEKFRDYLTEDIKHELQSYEEQNKNLVARNDELNTELQQLRYEKSKAKWSEESIRREVENEFYAKAIDELFESRIENVDVWFADHIAHQPPKCEYCNDDRHRVYVYPDGLKTKIACPCSQFVYCYEPKPSTLKCLQYRVKPSRYSSERKYYMADWKSYNPNDRYSDYGYSDFKIIHIVDKFDDNAIELHNNKDYGEKIGFKTKEACQEYCDWLNKK